MALSSKLPKIPRWSILVTGTSLLLFAVSIGVVNFERSDGSEDVLRADASPVEIGEEPAVEVARLGAPAGQDGATGASARETEWSKWGIDPSADPSWADGESWDEDAETEELSSLDCVIEPYQIVSIRSPVIGMVDAIHFDRSDVVDEGDVLVELESGPERATVDLARAKAELSASRKAREAALDLSKRRSERAKRLYAQHALSLDLREEVDTQAELARYEVEQAADDHRLAKLEHRQAVERLKRRTIRSPISGVVLERLITPGEVVDDEVILRLAQLDPLRVEIVLPAAGFGTIEPGSKVAVIPEIPGDEVKMGSVTIVDRVIDAASGTFGARLELPNPEGSIPSGLHCQVRFLDE